MTTNRAKTLTSLFVAFGIWLALDIASKQWAVSDAFQPLHFISNWFYLTEFQKNEGIAFSIYVPQLLQLIGSFVILFLILFYGLKHLLKEENVFQAILLGLVLAGGAGNLIDRLMQGYVVDFIVLKPIPVFNLADVGITVGLMLLFIVMIRNESKNKNP